MNINLSIILMALDGMNYENHVKNPKKLGFSMCLPLEENGTQSYPCLYVGNLSDALRRENSNNVIICRRDRLHDDSETPEKMENLIIINENISFSALLSLIQHRFFDVINWQQLLIDSVLGGCSVQELVDLSYPIIDGFFEITDSSFQLMGQSTKIDCDDPISIRLKEYGYHPEDTVKSFRDNDLFFVWERHDDVFYDSCTDVAKYPTLHKVFKFHGSYYAHCVMQLNRTPISDGLTELFRIFVDALSICIEKDWEGNISCVHPYDNLISDILLGKAAELSDLETRANYIGLPLSGSFHVVRAVPKSRQDVPFGSLLRSFGEKLKYIKYIYMNGSIAAIFCENGENSLSKLRADLESFSSQHSCICGISAGFDELVRAKGHLNQADLAIKYNRQLLSYEEKYPNINDCNNTGVVFFNDIYTYCALGEGKDFAEVWYGLKYHDIIKELYHHDALHQTNDIKLLRAFLEYQGQISGMAQKLNMHRNSVVYRLGRLNEMYGIDMDKMRDRTCIDVSLRLAELYGFK